MNDIGLANLQNAFGPLLNGGQAKLPFEDSLQAYLQHCLDTDEKIKNGMRVGLEARKIRLLPSENVIHTLEWGMGDGVTQAETLEAIHDEHGEITIISVAKEFNGNNVIIGNKKLVEGLVTHPNDVFVTGNLNYKQIAGFNPGAAQNFEWNVVRLKGTTAAEFQAQIDDLQKWQKEHWKFKPGTRFHDHPAALIVCRDDRFEQLKGIIPQKGDTIKDYKFVNLTQAVNLSRDLDFKVERAWAPGLERLAPGGVGVIIQAADSEHGGRIVRPLWPGFDPFEGNGPEDIARATLEVLTKRGKANGLKFNTGKNIDYHVHQLRFNNDGVYTEKALRTVYDAVVYHYQQDAENAREAVMSRRYSKPTRAALIASGGRFGFANSVTVATKDLN